MLKWTAAARTLIIYILATGSFFLLGFVAWVLARIVALRVIHMPSYLDRATYSTFEVLFVVAIYVISPLAAFFVTRRIHRFLANP